MTDIGPKRFRLIFRGELEPGADANDARALFRERFRVNEQTLEHCFSGRKVAVRSKLSEAEAFRLQSDLQEQGLITRIETTNEPPAPAPAPAPAERATPSPSPEPESAPPAPPEPANDSECRQCGHSILPAALHCPYCGARQEDRSGVWGLMAGLAAVLFLLIPLVAFLLAPLMQENRDGNRIDSAISQGEATAGKVRAFMARTGFRPNSNLDAGLAKPAELARPPLATITVSKGALITLRFQPGLAALGGKTIVFLPRTDDRGNPSWVCRPGTLSADHLPPRCRAEQSPSPAPTPATPAESEDPTLDNHNQTAAVARRVIGEEIESSRSIRERMLRFNTRQGRWPNNNAELGLEEPHMLGSYAVRTIRVQPGGRLDIEFIDSVAGNNGETALVLYRQGNRWLCRSQMQQAVLPEYCQRDPVGSR